VSIPDYISPIIGYRVWQWDTTGLKSVCGEPWHPGQPLVAGCRVYSAGKIVGRAEAAQGGHVVPQADCTCGVYAAKNLEHLRQFGYERYGIYGEVYLWGTVIEHEQGWRAQFAYPKNLYLPPDTLPFTLKIILSRIQTLIAFGCDVSIVHNGANIPVWRKESGLDADGLDFLIGMRTDWYARHKQERTLKRGDRLAILGRGIALVEQVEAEQVHAVLWNRSVLKIQRKSIVWDEQNMRWEANPLGMCQTRAETMTLDWGRKTNRRMSMDSTNNKLLAVG
jgi:hypothetical protein